MSRKTRALQSVGLMEQLRQSDRTVNYVTFTMCQRCGAKEGRTRIEHEIVCVDCYAVEGESNGKEEYDGILR